MESGWQDSEDPLAVKLIEDSYVVERCIGSGTFGTVLKARARSDPRRVVALKHLHGYAAEQIPIDYLRETVFFRYTNRHPNIVHLHEMFCEASTATAVYVLECMDGTLLQFMESAPRPMDQFLVGGIMKDILKGLEHIHASGFVHRDLKPENVLFRIDTSGRMAVKIADFGLSRPLDDASIDATRWTSYVATRWYRAPEQLVGLTRHTAALDVWAASLILFELCNFTPMFPGRSNIEVVALQVQRLGLPGAGSVAGTCPAVAHRLEVMGQWKDAYSLLFPQRSASFVTWSQHMVYVAPLTAGLRWDAQRRPSASDYLTDIRRILSEETRRRNRMRLSRPGGRLSRRVGAAPHQLYGDMLGMELACRGRRADGTSVQPVVDKPVVDRAEADRLDVNRAEADRLDVNRPEAYKPESDRPEADRPAAPRPAAETPAADRPKAVPIPIVSAVKGGQQRLGHILHWASRPPASH